MVTRMNSYKVEEPNREPLLKEEKFVPIPVDIWINDVEHQCHYIL